jgi:hypothetical protein
MGKGKNKSPTTVVLDPGGPKAPPPADEKKLPKADIA